MSLSLRLIRGSSPIFSSMTPEELLLIDILRLDNMSSAQIDNLEPFGELKELSLKYNRIQRIENLDFQNKV